MNRWERTDEVFDRVEQTLIVILLSLMLFIAFLQIILRNLFSTGLAWGDPLVRNLVLWIGFIGAALATKEGKHIRIDLVSRWLSWLGKASTDLINHLFSFSICVILCFAAFKFVINEAQTGHATFLGVPAWAPQIILPFTFGLMAFRFGLRSLEKLHMIMKIDNHHHPKREI